MKLKERTANNVHTAFVGEAKAHQRLLMFAEKAKKKIYRRLPTCSELSRQLKASIRGATLPSLSLSPTHRLTWSERFSQRQQLMGFTILRCCGKPKKMAKRLPLLCFRNLGMPKTSTPSFTRKHLTI